MDGDRVRELRDAHGISVQTAAKIVRGEELVQEIEGAQTVEDLKRVLLEIVRDNYPTI